MTHDERVYHHEMETCEGIHEHAERIAALEELVLDMWPHVRHRSSMCAKCELPCDISDECLLYEPMRQRMRKLGIEVTDG